MAIVVSYWALAGGAKAASASASAWRPSACHTGTMSDTRVAMELFDSSNPLLRRCARIGAMIQATDYASALARVTAPTPLTSDEIERLLDKAILDHRDIRAHTVRVTIPRHSIGKAAEMARDAGWATSIDRVRSAEPDAPDDLILRPSVRR